MPAWTNDDLTALEKATAQGVLEVRYGDKTVTYRSLNEMLRLLDIMRKELGVTTPNSGRRYADFHKGID